jgi:hypothetical protein
MIVSTDPDVTLRDIQQGIPMTYTCNLSAHLFMMRPLIHTGCAQSGHTVLCALSPGNPFARYKPSREENT